MRPDVRLPLFVLGMIGAAATGAAAQQIPVRVGGSTSSFVGIPFDVPLEVDMSARSDKLGSFALVLRWNPAVLHFVSGQNGNFGDLTGNDDSTNYGVIKLGGVNPTGVGGKVVLGVAHFVPLAASSDTIRLNVTELYAAGTFADLLPSAVWSNRAYCNAEGRFGDIDGDQAANSRDALLALSYSVGTAVPGNPAMGDVDGDGVTGARDALIILSNAVGLDVSAFRVLLVAPGACAAPARPALAVMPGNVTFDVGQVARYLAVASDSTGAGIAVADVFWKSSNDQAATVSPTGLVTAVGVGTATITAVRQGGTSASATVSVVQRRTHWVDALASPDQDNQLGAPELPFSTIPMALAYARAGDTIKVRPGRYADTLVINRAVVLMGDTTGGKPRPLISSRAVVNQGVLIHSRGRVELQALRLDTLTRGVDVVSVDTLLVRWVEFRAAPSAYYASLYVGSARSVSVQRATFFGPASGYSYYNGAINVASAGVVTIDSTYIAEYGYDGVDLSNVDSVFVRGSTIRHNTGHGLYAVSPGLAAVFSGNAFVENGYGQVYLDGSRGAHFDHNLLTDVTGSTYDGIVIYGDTALTDVTLLGDSLSLHGGWIGLQGFDSLGVDSVRVFANATYSYPYINGGRVVTIRRSKFLEVSGYAVDVNPSPRTRTQVLLRGVEFRGPAQAGKCDRCANMVYGTALSVDADSVTVTNAYYGFDLSNSRAVVNHLTLDGLAYGAYASCGYLNLANSALSNGSYGAEVYGCGAGDTLIVTNSTFTQFGGDAVYGYKTLTNVTGSQFTDDWTAIYHNCGQLRVSNVTGTGGYYGVQGSGCAASDTLRIDQSSFAAFTGYGAYLASGTHVVTNSQFADDQYGVYAVSGPAAISNNQVIRPQYRGIFHSWSVPAAGNTQIVNNLISCDATGAISANGVDLEHSTSSVRDTLTAQGNSVTNCYQGVYLVGGWRAVARGNTVSLPTTIEGYRGISADADTTAVIAANTVSGRGRYGSIWVGNTPAALVDSNAVTGGIGAGLMLAGPFDSLHARDNTITNLTYGSGYIVPSAAILLAGGTYNLTSYLAEIRRNRITHTTNGILLSRSANDTLTIQVDSNTVRDADSLGIGVTYYSYARIRFNAIDSSGLDGVRLYSSYLARPAAVLDSNNFTRSQHFGVRNLTAYPVVATYNWWNDAKGPDCAFAVGCDTTSVGDSVSTLVTFSPFLGAAFATYAPAPPLIGALGAAPPLVAGAPSVQGPRRTWEAQPDTPPSRGPTAVPSLRAGPTIPAAPAVETANRVARQLAREAATRGRHLEQREADRAQRIRQLEESRTARDQAQVERLRAEAARRQAQQAPGPQGRRQ